MRLVCILMIMGILIQSTFVSAAEKVIILDQKSAAKLTGDIEYFKLRDQLQVQQIDEYKSIKSNLEEESKLKDQKIEGLTKDFQIQQERADKFQDVYSKTSKELIDVKANQPSRYTWFSTGFISAIILGIVGAFAVR